LLFEGKSETQAADAVLNTQTLIEGVNSLSLDFQGRLDNGALSVVWEGGNDDGQWVGGGMYYLKVETKDSFGKVTTYTREISVVDARPQQFLTIYNSAGERVRRIELPAGTLYSELKLSEQAFAMEAQAGPSNGYKLELRSAAGVSSQVEWDGLTDQGARVRGGSYSVVLVSKQGISESKVVTRSFIVLDAGADDPLKNSVAAPNPLKGQDRELQISYAPAAMSSGQRVTAELYTLSGERVASGSDSTGMGRLVLGLPQLSSGVYFVRLQLMSGMQSEKSKTLKISIVR